MVEDLSEKRRLEEARRAEEERRQTEEAKRRHLEETLGRFVAPNVRERLLKAPDLSLPGGKKKEVTVLFADLRGFTALSEQSSPETVVDMLNRNLSLSTRAILKYEGTLDKFMGDAIMAFFNAPLPQEDHALRAVRAAIEMRAALEDSRGGSGHQPSYGIGIHTGQAIVGIVGTPELMNYTAIGDAVNVAQRLQASAGPGEILLSEGTYDHVRGMAEVEVMPPLSVKGRAAPIVGYRLLGLKKGQQAAA